MSVISDKNQCLIIWVRLHCFCDCHQCALTLKRTESTGHKIPRELCFARLKRILWTVVPQCLLILDFHVKYDFRKYEKRIWFSNIIEIEVVQ